MSTCFLCLFLDSSLVLSKGDVIVFVLSWYYPLEAFLFSTETQEGVDLTGGGAEGTGRRRGRGTHNQGILPEGKTCPQ